MKNIKSLNKFTLTNIKSYGIVLIAFLILFPMQSTGLISNSISGQLVPICTYIVMAISLSLTVGFLGELSLGHAGFMSVGAFTGVIAASCLSTVVHSNALLLFLSVLIGGIFAGIAGFIIGIPVLRLRGDYLAIVTLAFGEIIKNIINCLYVGVDAFGIHVGMKSAEALEMVNGRLIINGPQGAVGITKLSSFPAGDCGKTGKQRRISRLYAAFCRS